MREWCLRWGLTGFLFGVPFLMLDLWFVALIGLVYLFQNLERTNDTRSLYLGMWFAFIIKYLFALGWFWSVYPIEWLAVEVGSIQIALIAFSWIMCGLALGLGGVAFAFLYRFLRRHTFVPAWSLFFLIPLVWVGSEIVAAYAFSIVSIGPGGAITPAFSFGYSGYLLAQHESFLHLARIAGVYGLSFVFTLFAFCLYHLWERYQSLRGRAFISLGFLGICAFGLVPIQTSYEASSNTYRVVSIDTRFPVQELRTNEGRMRTNVELYSALEHALALDADYVIFPEDSRLFDQALPVSSNKATLRARLDEVSAVIVDSGRFEQNGEKPVLQAFVYDGVEDSVERVQKRYLVPQGEFLSSFSNLMLTLTGFGETVEEVGAAISFQVGPYTDQSDMSSITPGILFCFESVDPLGVRKIMNERGEVPFIAHPISHAWFNEPTTLWPQLDTMLRVQALWNQVSIVSAGGHVAGAIYTPSGEKVDMITVAETEEWSVRVGEVSRI